MILKLFKGMWFLSMLGVLANLLYVYASLPEQVIIQEETTGQIFAGREFLFYAVLGVIALVNVLVYFAAKVYEKAYDFRSWFYGLIITINIFFVFAMSLVLVYNSAESYNYSSVGFTIYGSVALMLLWAAAWPVYSLFRKLFPKQAVSHQ